MPKKLQIATIIYISALVAANIIAVKIVDIAGYIVPAGIIVFPITYIIGDVITEVYGFKVMKRIIFYGFFANAIVFLFILLSIQLEPANFWLDQESYELVLSSTPRILLASFSGYLLGSLGNAWSMEYIKKLTKSRFLWLRTTVSTLIGEGIDTLIFVSIAFVYVFDSAHIQDMIITQWLIKVAYEVIATPLTYLAVNWFKRGNDK
jgi:queuosine precursor transporter